MILPKTGFNFPYRTFSLCLLYPLLFLSLNLVTLLDMARAEEVKPQTLPNFLVIMVDDLGARDLGCYGGTYIQTPNIDQLAKEGILATRAYAAAAICSPTRAAWITGRHPARLGITDWIRSRFQRPESVNINVLRSDYDTNPNQPFQTPTNPFYMPLSETTVAEIVKQKGYKTAHVGKWHLGDEPWYPEQQGFDLNLGGCDFGQPPTYFDPFKSPNAKHESLRLGIPGITSRSPGEFLTDREIDETIAIMAKWRDTPFYIQLNHYAVHTPIEAPEDATRRYLIDGKTLQQARYAALVESVDRGLGKLRSAIRNMNLERPTVIVFTSDNGGLDQNGRPTDNAPLRDGKGTPYEGGLRIPLIFYGDGVLAAGQILDAPTCSMDWFPTLCDLIQLEHPKDVALDGISLLPLLRTASTNRTTSDFSDRRLVWHFPHYRGNTLPYSVLQESSWKLIVHYGAPAELYNLEKDPNEQNNLATTEESRVEAMKAKLSFELTRLGASIPREK